MRPAYVPDYDLPTTEAGWKSLIRQLYKDSFDSYQDDWQKLIARVEIAEKKAELATNALDVIKLTLGAMGAKGKR